MLDVTSFLSEHPGGELAILTFAGKDATEEFNMCLGIGKMGKGGGCKVFATQGEILVDFAGKKSGKCWKTEILLSSFDLICTAVRQLGNTRFQRLGQIGWRVKSRQCFMMLGNMSQQIKDGNMFFCEIVQGFTAGGRLCPSVPLFVASNLAGELPI